MRHLLASTRCEVEVKFGTMEAVPDNSDRSEGFGLPQFYLTERVCHETLHFFRFSGSRVEGGKLDGTSSIRQVELLGLREMVL
jgi:hypothetical protein